MNNLLLLISILNIIAILVLIIKIVGASIIRKASIHFESILFLTILQEVISVILIFIPSIIGANYYIYIASLMKNVILIFSFIICYKMLVGSKEILESMNSELVELATKLSIIIILVAFVIIPISFILIFILTIKVTFIGLVLFIISFIINFIFSIAYFVYLFKTSISFSSNIK